VRKGDGAVRTAREEAVCRINFLREGVSVAGAQLCSGDGEEGTVGDEAGAGGVEGGEDLG